MFGAVAVRAVYGQLNKRTQIDLKVVDMSSFTQRDWPKVVDRGSEG